MEKETAPSQTTTLSSIRESAQSAFDALPFSHSKYGLDIQPGFSTFDFESVISSPRKELPVRVHEIRADGIILSDFRTAFEKYPEKIGTLLGSLLNSSDKFESFHLANLQSGLFVYVPGGVRASAPISLLPHFDSFSHVLILAEPESAVSFVQIHIHSPLESSFQSSGVEIFARSGSSVHFCSIQDFPPNVSRVSFNRAHVSGQAGVVWSCGEFGSSIVKGDCTSYLMGEGASARHMGVFVQNSSQHMDWRDSVHHLAPKTNSHLFARATLDDDSKIVYRGLVKMTKDARGSIGSQRVDSLVLSPRAESDPVPALEIEGSEMRCSHAATVGRLDAEKLFYLTSRGLDESTARAIYIQGFFERVLGEFPPDSPVPFIRSHTARKLGLSLPQDEFTPFLSEVLA